MRFIDLRSDTVTKPSGEMRQAMAEADVGDDVFREDPTVSLLEEKAAALLGFEASLFVPSGTMANQVALAVQTRRGDEVILEERCHIYNYELSAMAVFAGTLPRSLPSEGGAPTPAAVRGALRPAAYYFPRTGLLALENTHNSWAGRPIPPDRLAPLVAIAKEAGIPVHLDGARIWNAAAALAVEASELCRGFDSVMFCLSKGLGAPVGSMLAGSRSFIEEARRVRKRMGGGMRQVGILAAAGLCALENRKRLAEDHARARRLAEGIAELPGLGVDYGGTNILMVDLPSPAEEALTALRREGFLAVPFGPRRIRLTTHLDVDDEAIDSTLLIFSRLFAHGNRR